MEDRSRDLIVANADGSDQVVLAEGSGDLSGSPVWSPAGDRIIWMRGNQLWSIDANGGEPMPMPIDFKGDNRLTLAWAG